MQIATCYNARPGIIMGGNKPHGYGRDDTGNNNNTNNFAQRELYHSPSFLKILKDIMIIAYQKERQQTYIVFRASSEFTKSLDRHGFSLPSP
jgi:hypothetical protein